MLLITHDGRFHYDEILATVMLLIIFPDSSVIRTRDAEIIKTGNIVYDVGRVFDPASGRFDHHQDTFKETFSDEFNTVKLSSAGLIFKYYHERLLSLFGINPKHRLYKTLVNKIYKEFILPADAIDNGYDGVHGTIPGRTVYDLVRDFNLVDDNLILSEKQNRRFFKAVKVIRKDFCNYMRYKCLWAQNYEYTENMVKGANGPILVLNRHCSTNLILEFEKIYKKDIRYIIFPSQGKFTIIAIPVESGSTKTKTPLKEEWRGLADEALSAKAGIDGCVFVHANGFLGVNLTLDGAIEMAKKSLKDSGYRNILRGG